MELRIIGSIFGARTNIAVRAYSGAIFFLVYFLFSGRKFVSITLALTFLSSEDVLESLQGLVGLKEEKGLTSTVL
jgi:hypothetical protein